MRRFQKAVRLMTAYSAVSMLGWVSAVSAQSSLSSTDRQRVVEQLLVQPGGFSTLTADTPPAPASDVRSFDTPSINFDLMTKSENMKLAFDHDTAVAVTPVVIPNKPIDFTLQVRGATGYDSNPGKSPSADGSAFGEVGGRLTVEVRGRSYGGDFDKPSKYQQLLTLYYDASLRLFEGDFSTLDRTTQLFDVAFKQRILDRTELTLEAKDTHISLNENPTLNQVELIPAARYYFAPWVAVETGYNFTYVDALFDPTSPSRDPSGQQHTTVLSGIFTPQEKDRLAGVVGAATLSLAHTWSDPDGTDLQYEGNRIAAGLSQVRFWTNSAVYADLAYYRDYNRYENTDSVALTKRHDRINTLALTLTDTLVNDTKTGHTSKLYAKLAVTNNDSNLTNRNYDEYTVSVGINVGY